MKPTNPLYALYWDYAEFRKESKEFNRAEAVFSKFLDCDTVTDLLCELEERAEMDAFHAGFMTATQIFVGGDGE